MNLKGKLATLMTVIVLATTSLVPTVSAKVDLEQSPSLVPAQSQTTTEQQEQQEQNISPQKMVQQKMLDNLNQKKSQLAGDANFQVHWNEQQGIPKFIQGVTTDEQVQSKKDVLGFVDKNKPLFNLTDSRFNINQIIEDEAGNMHYKMKQVVDGIEVYGKELIVHTEPDGTVYAINGDVSPGIDTAQWSTVPTMDADSILKIAEKFVSKGEEIAYLTPPTTDLYLYEFEKDWYVAYLVNLQFTSPFLANYNVFVDAEYGNVINSYNRLTDVAAVGSGVGVHGDTKSLDLDYTNGRYELVNTTHSTTMKTYTMNNNVNSPRPGDIVYDTDTNFNASSQGPAVDAHANIEIVYEYYLNEHNRNSYDNQGTTIVSSVNYYDAKYKKNNAFWTGTQMLYGDGDGQQFSPFSAALDVVAHEFTHAVTQETCNLEYQFQSGAINESMSDVFGAIIEDKENGEWWLIGEDCYTPGTAGDALRDMKNPEALDYPGHMDDYQNLPITTDNGGVHINSSIPNKAFYYIASDIGFNKSGKIYYKALSQYLTSQSNFMDLRTALLQSATDLYGANSSEYQSVNTGFSNVGLGTTTSNDTYEPNNSTSEAYGPLTTGQQYESYISTSSDQDYYHFTTESTGQINVTLKNLPGDYDLYLYNQSGTKVGQSENSSTNNESISYNGSAGKYYVKVIGYNGANSTQTAYHLEATYPTGGGSTLTWYNQNISYDTPHNYANNYDKTVSYTKTGASKVRVHFSKFELEKDYDFVYIYDKNENLIATYTGTLDPFWATVDGDKMYIRIVTDAYVTDYGFTLDQAGYYHTEVIN